jgi:putative ABC transport system permease protein
MISCVGIFGLAAFARVQRMKVVSIRKVTQRARVFPVKLVTADFVLLSFTAILMAVPVCVLFEQYATVLSYRAWFLW